MAPRARPGRRRKLRLPRRGQLRRPPRHQVGCTSAAHRRRRSPRPQRGPLRRCPARQPWVRVACQPHRGLPHRPLRRSRHPGRRKPARVRRAPSVRRPGTRRRRPSRQSLHRSPGRPAPSARRLRRAQPRLPRLEHPLLLGRVDSSHHRCRRCRRAHRRHWADRAQQSQACRHGPAVHRQCRHVLPRPCHRGEARRRRHRRVPHRHHLRLRHGPRRR